MCDLGPVGDKKVRHKGGRYRAMGWCRYRGGEKHECVPIHALTVYPYSAGTSLATDTISGPLHPSILLPMTFTCFHGTTHHQGYIQDLQALAKKALFQGGFTSEMLLSETQATRFNIELHQILYSTPLLYNKIHACNFFNWIENKWFMGFQILARAGSLDYSKVPG